MIPAIATYDGIKAYITSWALGCPGIPSGAFIWGEEKRMLDSQAATLQSPYFWVTDYRKIMRGYESNTQIYSGWELAIEVKAASKPDDRGQQEANLKQCESIVDTFLRWLAYQHQTNQVYFHLNNTSILDQEHFEIEDHWGWQFTITLLVPINCYKYQPAEGSFAVLALAPVWGGSAGTLLITVDATTVDTEWEAETNKPFALAKLMEKARAAGLKVFTDGMYLYVIGSALGATLTVLWAGGAHTFTTLLSTQGSNAS